MPNVVDQSAWWNPLLTSVIFTWLGGTARYLHNKCLNNQLYKQGSTLAQARQVQQKKAKLNDNKTDFKPILGNKCDLVLF